MTAIVTTANIWTGLLQYFKRRGPTVIFRWPCKLCNICQINAPRSSCISGSSNYFHTSPKGQRNGLSKGWGYHRAGGKRPEQWPAGGQRSLTGKEAGVAERGLQTLQKWWDTATGDCLWRERELERTLGPQTGGWGRAGWGAVGKRNRREEAQCWEGQPCRSRFTDSVKNTEG